MDTLLVATRDVSGASPRICSLMSSGNAGVYAKPDRGGGKEGRRGGRRGEEESEWVSLSNRCRSSSLPICTFPFIGTHTFPQPMDTHTHTHTHTHVSLHAGGGAAGGGGRVSIKGPSSQF